MSAERASHAQAENKSLKKDVGVAMEWGAAIVTPLEMLATGLILWPLAIGGAIFLIGRGLRRGGKKESAGGSH